jgi:hypothetical protein
MNCARILLAFIPLKPFRTILRILIILLVAIVVLYMLVVLLGKKRQPMGRDGLVRLDRRPALPAVNRSSTMPHYVSGMDETQALAAQALCEPPALSPDIFTSPEGSALLARPRLMHAITADRAVVAAAEIATLKQKLAAAEARIREIEAAKDNAFKPFTSWKSDKTKSTPTLDNMRERLAALLRHMNNPVEG